MPLTEKGNKILANMQRQYGEKKGKSVFYASMNKGTISGVEPGHQRGGIAYSKERGRQVGGLVPRVSAFNDPRGWMERLPDDDLYWTPGFTRDIIPPKVLMQLQGYPAGTIVGGGNPDPAFIRHPEFQPVGEFAEEPTQRERREAGYFQAGGLVQPQPQAPPPNEHPDDDFELIDVAPQPEMPAYISTLERLNDARNDAQGIPLMRQMGGPIGPPTAGTPTSAAMRPLASPWGMSSPMRDQSNQWPSTGLYSSGGGLVGLVPGEHFQRGGLTESGMSALGKQAHYSGLNVARELGAVGAKSQSIRAPRSVSGMKLVQSATPGRTDRIPVRARSGSFVLPADVVSGLGQGNTMAGAKMWGQAISHASGPYGTAGGGIRASRSLPVSLPRPAMPRSPRGEKFQGGGLSGYESSSE